MARRSQTPTATVQPAQTIVASARRVDLKDRTATKKAMSKPAKWQEQAWLAFGMGEVKYPLRYRANAVSRLRIFAAVRPTPDAEPVPVSDPGSGVPADIARRAADALERLSADVGGQRAIITALCLNLDVAAEGYLVGLDAKEASEDPVTHMVTPARDESWNVYSVSALKVTPEGEVRIHASPDDVGTPLDPDAFVLRVWTPDPEWPNRPDCELRGVLDKLEELGILGRMIRAQGRSRTTSGILFLNQDLDFRPANRTQGDGGDGQAKEEDTFANDLMLAMTTPVKDEDDPTAVVPLIVRGKGDQVGSDKNWHLKLDREIDKTAIDLRKELRQGIAEGMPVPVEVSQGMTNANHWTAWQVTEDTFRAHIEPTAIAIFDALTAGYLRPMITTPAELPEGMRDDAGVDEEWASRIFVWYDATDLVTKPDRAQDAKDAHDRFTISDDALNDALGFSDGDKPDPDEIARRIAIKRGLVDSPLTEALLSVLLPQLVAQAQAQRETEAQQAIDATSASADDTPAAEGDGQGAPEGDGDAAIAASAAARNPGQRLVEIDARLATRLEVAMDAALERALERAGARLRSKMNGNATLRSTVQRVPQSQVAATLGRSIVATVGLSDDELLDGAFSGLDTQYEQWVEQAQTDALAVVEGAFGELDPAVAEATRARQAEERQGAWEWTLGALLSLAATRLYDPDPSASEHGEHDNSMRVPVPLIRESMTRAGGAEGLQAQQIPGSGGGNRLVAADGAPAGAVATGQTVIGCANSLNVVLASWQWQYAAFGGARSGFAGHRQLDGVVFDSWYDERLAVHASDAWIGQPFYSPGDHRGCRCYAAPVLFQGG